ncbi:predicted protein [Lichtheimia corymbifera JMRC:FSU:9682]|uniref:Uncharacterized protein n=1 Tax=Lichtheimia corymbifera JMRC:FSU:9682 TaxID=1263082 RepID=A0A068SC33_9FUNG|nr:predicted protein [Lichtheimia corymbifera JMRC:FSU:9682]
MCLKAISTIRSSEEQDISPANNMNAKVDTKLPLRKLRQLASSPSTHAFFQPREGRHRIVLPKAAAMYHLITYDIVFCVHLVYSSR